MAADKAIRVAILWHMHQPNYRDPQSDKLTMPWVRLHALKDYLDMPLAAAAHENIKVTFNLVPSLIDQLDHYLKGGTDRHLELTRINAEELNDELKIELLDSFFSAHPENMIYPYHRYRELYQKYLNDANHSKTLPAIFSSAEMRDLQIWSNLTWIDPVFRDEKPLKELFEKKRNYTEADKDHLIKWQMGIIGKIIPTYADLREQGIIEISFTPYYHPILPLLCDTDSAREALPTIKLPRKRFEHPEDAERQIRMAIDKYESLFGGKMQGLWPSEGSVSEDVLRLILNHDIKWTASDEEILHSSLKKSGLEKHDNPLHTVYDYGPGLKIFFRDHNLSDRIGFVYSSWEADRAVQDFLGQIKNIRSTFYHQLDRVVVPIILDGENAWEYFPEDGREFLSLLYERLGEDPEIEMVTMSEAAEQVPARSLPRVFAGSWINHNFRIWIGHPEDNAAWDLLTQTRNRLEQYEREFPDFDKAILKQAWDQIYIAEGSDWCWWYGDEHRGAHNEQFDKVFRHHLMAVYRLLGLDIPYEMHDPIHGGKAQLFTTLPSDILTAQIDGQVTHFYEWAGAGYYDCLKAGGAMHRMARYISAIHFGYDHNRFYIRLDFYNKKNIELLKDLKLVFGFYTPNPVMIELAGPVESLNGELAEQYQYSMDEIFELAVERNHIWPRGYGQLSMNISLMDGKNELENWPENEPIQLEVPEKNKEMFWPS